MSPLCNSSEIYRKFIPSKETENKGFQMDDFGFIRIVVDNKKGNWTGYDGIACLEIDGQYYIGVSAYYGGIIPHECVLKVEKVSD